MVYLLGFQGWQKKIVGKKIVCAHSKAGLWLSHHLELSRKHGPDAALPQILWFSFDVWTIQAAGVTLPSVLLPASDAAVSLANQRPVKSGFLLKSSIFVLLWSLFSKEDPCLVPLEVKPMRIFGAKCWCLTKGLPDTPGGKSCLKEAAECLAWAAASEWGH